MALKTLIPVPASQRHSYSSLLHIQDSFNDLLNTFLSETPFTPSISPLGYFPSISVAETEKMVTVRAELPAVTKDDVKVDIQKNRLIISGEKKIKTEQNKETYHLCEIAYGKFSRTVALNFEINPDKVNASFVNGVLTIEVLKSEAEIPQTRSIAISS